MFSVTAIHTCHRQSVWSIAFYGTRITGRSISGRSTPALSLDFWQPAGMADGVRPRRDYCLNRNKSYNDGRTEMRNTLAVWENAWNWRGLAPFFAAMYRIHKLGLDREKRGLTPSPRTTLLQAAKVLRKCA